VKSKSPSMMIISVRGSSPIFKNSANKKQNPSTLHSLILKLKATQCKFKISTASYPTWSSMNSYVNTNSLLSVNSTASQKTETGPKTLMKTTLCTLSLSSIKKRTREVYKWGQLINSHLYLHLRMK